MDELKFLEKVLYVELDDNGINRYCKFDQARQIIDQIIEKIFDSICLNHFKMRFDISGKNLRTLQGIEFPEGITKLNCSNNSLRSLQYCPKSVTQLNCSYNKLTSLEYCPKSVTLLNCRDNTLTSLQYCPSPVTYLHCSHNSLTSLEYCPNFVTQLYCDNNSLTSLQSCPNSVRRLDCSNNSLTSLQDCPNSVIYLFSDNNPLSPEYFNKSIEEIHKINTLKSYTLGIHKLNSMIFSVRIQRSWKKYWYDELDDNGINRYCKFALDQAQHDGILI